MRKLEYLFDENDYEKGIFFNIGNSRSGHNFIKEMILSWTSDENHKLRKYINLENRPPSMFNEFVKNISLSPTSICVLITRDLLNWFTSISYFMINNIERSKRYNCKLSEQNLIHVSDIKNKTEIEKDPNKVIIPDSISKTQYLINIKNKEKNIPLKLNKALDSWLQIAKEFCGITNYLSAQFIKIYYDTFFSDKSYRKNICNTIGGTYSEKK